MKTIAIDIIGNKLIKFPKPNSRNSAYAKSPWELKEDLFWTYLVSNMVVR